MKSWSFLMVALLLCLSASAESRTEGGTFDGLKIDYTVSLVEANGELNLNITLKNDSDTPYYIAAWDLPWLGFRGMKVCITPDFPVSSDQQWETEYLPCEQFAGASDIELKAGSEISGSYRLSEYFDLIKKFRDRGDIGINWNFKLKVHTQDRYQAASDKDKMIEDKVIEAGRVGGFFVVPKSMDWPPLQGVRE